MKTLVILLGLLFATQAHAVQDHGIAQQGLPSAAAEGGQKQKRVSKYGEPVVVPLSGGGLEGLADEGSYFSAMTATPGTAYALGGATQTAWVATTPTFFIKNNNAAAGERIYMDQCRITVTTIGTGITSIQYAVVLDRGSRTTSAGTALTSANVNGATALSSNATGIVAGAVTASAATTPLYLARGSLKNAAPTIGDTFIINFGAIDGAAAASPPAILDGAQSLLVYLWYPGSSAAATGEVQCSWWER